MQHDAKSERDGLADDVLFGNIWVCNMAFLLERIQRPRTRQGRGQPPDDAVLYLVQDQLGQTSARACGAPTRITSG